MHFCLQLKVESVKTVELKQEPVTAAGRYLIICFSLREQSCSDKFLKNERLPKNYDK